MILQPTTGYAELSTMVAGGETYVSVEHGLHLHITRVARDRAWADIRVSDPTGRAQPWTKRQTLCDGRFPFEVRHRDETCAVPDQCVDTLGTRVRHLRHVLDAGGPDLDLTAFRADLEHLLGDLVALGIADAPILRGDAALSLDHPEPLMSDLTSPTDTAGADPTSAPAPSLSSAATKLLTVLRSHGNTRTYLAHAARSRYAVVAETARPGRYRFEHAVSAPTVGELERAGLIEHDERRESRVELGEFSGRRHLDSRDGEPVRLTAAGRAR